MQVFIPLSDDDLERLPAGERLVPYCPGRVLLSQLEERPKTGVDEISRCESSARRRDERPARPPFPP